MNFTQLAEKYEYYFGNKTSMKELIKLINQ